MRTWWSILDQAVRQRLAAIVRSEHIRDDLADMVPYSYVAAPIVELLIEAFDASAQERDRVC